MTMPVGKFMPGTEAPHRQAGPPAARLRPGQQPEGAVGQSAVRAATSGTSGGGVRPRVLPVAPPAGSAQRPQQPLAEAPEDGAGRHRQAATPRRSGLSARGHLIDIRS